MTAWILTHLRLAAALFFGGFFLLALASVLGALEIDRWWQIRRDGRRLVAEVEAVLAEAADNIDRAEGQ